MRLVATIAIACATSCGIARADMAPPVVCAAVAADNSDSLVAMMQRRAMPVLLSCRAAWEGGGFSHFLIATPVRKSTSGICRYEVVRVERSGQGIWSENRRYIPPPNLGNDTQLYDARGGKPCPAQGSEDYVAAIAISDSDFAGAMDFWHDLSSSQSVLDAALPWWPDQQKRNRYNALREALFHAKPDESPLVPTSIHPMFWMDRIGHPICWIENCYDIDLGTLADANITIAIGWFGGASLVDVDRYVI